VVNLNTVAEKIKPEPETLNDIKNGYKKCIRNKLKNLFIIIIIFLISILFGFNYYKK